MQPSVLQTAKSKLEFWILSPLFLPYGGK